MVKEEPHIFLVAAEDIEVGAELLFDYGIRYWTIRQGLPSLIILLSDFQWPFVLFTVKLILLSSDKEYINANPWIVNTWSCVISTMAAVFDGDINFVLLKLFWTDIWSFFLQPCIFVRNQMNCSYSNSFAFSFVCVSLGMSFAICRAFPLSPMWSDS